MRRLLADNRLVTLTGAGGSGKTRLAIQVASEFGDGVRYVDLAPITDPDLVPVAVARALGLPDQPGRSRMDTVVRFIGERQLLLVLDNCEHLLDSSAELILALLGACPDLTLLTTSREPIGLAGEVTWRVPSLSLTDEAVELFEDRARRVRPDFTATEEDAVTVNEICRRLDGMPLAIELAAARVRALSLTEILDSLHDRFRLLTGGSRRAVRRQQSLGASVDWSHALLTEPERILFRRLSAFMGGFDLDAAQEVCSGGALPRHQILDQLTLLVDKSLVVAESTSGRTRYRLLETIRQYALEKLGESGEADAVRDSHRDYYTSMAARFDAPTPAGSEHLLDQAEIEIDNLRAAFAWSLEHQEIERALQLACSLYPLWLVRGRLLEGLAWFDSTGVSDPGIEVGAAVRARALADNAVLGAFTVSTHGIGQAEEALAIARELGEPVLLARALTSCIAAAAFDAQAARPYVAEAIALARELGDRWRLSQILAWQAYMACLAGNPVSTAAAGKEGYTLADAVGDRFISRMCRFWGLGIARFPARRAGRSRTVIARPTCRGGRVGGRVPWPPRPYRPCARDAAIGAYNRCPHSRPRQLWRQHRGWGPSWSRGRWRRWLRRLSRRVTWQRQPRRPMLRGNGLWSEPELAIANVMPTVELALLRGELTSARQLADDAVAPMMGWHRAKALTTRAHVAIAQGEMEQAECDAHDALVVRRRGPGLSNRS